MPAGCRAGAGTEAGAGAAGWAGTGRVTGIGTEAKPGAESLGSQIAEGTSEPFDGTRARAAAETGA